MVPNLTVMVALSIWAYNQKFSSEYSTIMRFQEVKISQPAFNVLTKDNAIYIAIRGSSAQEDYDTVQDGFEIQTPYGVFHEGFYKAAMYVLLKVSSLLKNYKGDLYITGHSYGGSVASILLILIRNIYPSINSNAVAFGPPPCMSLKTSEPYTTYITSVVNENDLIPTFSVGNVYQKIIQKNSMVRFLESIEIVDIISDIFDSYNTTGVIGGNIIIMSLKKTLPDLAEQIIKMAHGLKSEVRYVAGTVIQINAGKTGKISDFVIDPTKNLNIMSADKSAIADHAPRKYEAAVALITQ